VVAEYRDRELRDLFREIAQYVRYQDFDHLPVERFQQLSDLVVSDLWTDRTEGQKAAKIGFTEDELPILRATPEYEGIKFAYREAFDRLKEPQRLEDHMSDMIIQDRVARATIRTALHHKDGRVRIKAMEQINDRAMPRITKGGDTKIVMIRSEDLHLLQETERQLLEADVKVLDVESSEVHTNKAGRMEKEG
jgi:hypothetical protein